MKSADQYLLMLKLILLGLALHWVIGQGMCVMLTNSLKILILLTFLVGAIPLLGAFTANLVHADEVTAGPNISSN